jgi:hypothetical protein
VDWRETSMMVDYTDFEDLNILRERKGKMYVSHHRATTERRNFLFREIF